MSQILTFNSGGSGGIPVVQINGDTGSAVGPIITFDAYPASGQSVIFHALGSTVSLVTTDSTGNTLIGLGSGDAGVTGTNNTALGKNTLNTVSTGSSNIAIGYQAMAATTTGSSNIVIGGGGANTSLLGSNNIIIGNPSAVPGAISNETVIGNDTTNKVFIAGIDGINVGSVATVVTEFNSQLGTATIAAGAGITVTPTANTITIASTGILTINGNSGSATGNPLTIKVNQASLPAYFGGSTVNFYASGSTDQLSFTDNLDNTGVGYNSLASLAGAGGSNTAFGFESLNAVTSGDNNTGIGTAVGPVLTTGSSNTFVGYEAGLLATTGDANTLIGVASANRLTTGQYNIILGSATNGALPFTSASGYNYTSSESSNLIIGNLGVTGESNVLRIGTTGSGSGQQNKCYISGIDGVNIGSVAKVLTMASEQIGTATITAGSGITVTPGANTITISAAGSDILAYTNVNTTPYVVLLTDEYLSVDASAGPITLQFPNAPAQGTVFYVKDRAGFAGTNNITITSVGGAIGFDGGLTYVMNTAYSSVNLILGQTNYEIF